MKYWNISELWLPRTTCFFSVSTPAAIALTTTGVLGAGASVASGIIGSNAAQSAAQTQAAAANTASTNQLNEFNQIQGNLQPYVTAGQGSLSTVQNLLGLTGPGGTAPAGGTPNTAAINAALTQTPGYQFTLNQGLESTQNSYAAQGLGTSGAALKGAATFATGLAQQTYEQQLQNYLNLAQTGESAAAQAGSLGNQAVSTAGQFSTSGAAASAAGTVGSANALTNALTGVGTNATSTALATALFSNGTGSPSLFQPNFIPTTSSGNSLGILQPAPLTSGG